MKEMHEELNQYKLYHCPYCNEMFPRKIIKQGILTGQFDCHNQCKKQIKLIKKKKQNLSNVFLKFSSMNNAVPDPIPANLPS